MRTNELMLYKHMEEGQILQDMTFLMENYQNDYYNMEDMKGLLYDAVNEILEMAVSHGFEGDLWHNYLTYLMASHENAYSTSCEIVGPVDGSINQVALHDFEIFKELFDYDFVDLENVMVWTVSLCYMIMSEPADTEVCSIRESATVSVI